MAGVTGQERFYPQSLFSTVIATVSLDNKRMYLSALISPAAASRRVARAPKVVKPVPGFVFVNMPE